MPTDWCDTLIMHLPQIQYLLQYVKVLRSNAAFMKMARRLPDGKP